MSKIRVSALLSKRVFIQSLSYLVNMLMGIISLPSSITSQIPPGTPELWPLNCPKLGFPLSKAKSCHPVFIKLGEYDGGHNISTKFYSLPNPIWHSWIMALELSKNWISGQLSCSQKCCHYHWIYHKYDGRILCQFGYFDAKCLYGKINVLNILN